MINMHLKIIIVHTIKSFDVDPRHAPHSCSSSVSQIHFMCLIKIECANDEVLNVAFNGYALFSTSNFSSMASNCVEYRSSLCDY